MMYVSVIIRGDEADEALAYKQCLAILWWLGMIFYQIYKIKVGTFKMTFKVSNIVLAFFASASFCVAAETIVQGSQVDAQADLVVAQDASLSLIVNPVANLTVADIRKGRATVVAQFKVAGSSGGNTAVSFFRQNHTDLGCSNLKGSFTGNRMQVCLDSQPAVFQDGGADYFKVGNGEYKVVSSGNNADSTTPVEPDSYELALTLVRYAN